MVMKRSLWRMSGTLAVAAVLSICQMSPLRADDEAPASDPAATEEAETPESTAAEDTDESSEDDGVRVQGKIIVIGPDGEKREFDFGRNFPKKFMGPRVKMLPRGPVPLPFDDDATPRGFFRMDPEFAPGDYMIGVHCEPAGDALRAQLGLGENGLVVQTIIEDSPAAEAGLQVHDILVRIGDQELTEISQLLEAVQDAEETSLTLTVLRGGEEQTIKLTPAKREDVDLPMAFRGFSVQGMPEGERTKWLQRLQRAAKEDHAHPGHFRFEAVGPGILLHRAQADAHDKALPKELQSQIDELKNQLEALQATVDQLSESDD